MSSKKRRSVFDASLLEPFDPYDEGQKKGKMETGDAKLKEPQHVKSSTPVKRDKTPKRKKAFVSDELFMNTTYNPAISSSSCPSFSSPPSSTPHSPSASSTKKVSVHKTPPSYLDNPFQKSASPKVRNSTKSPPSFSFSPSLSVSDNTFQKSVSPKSRVKTPESSTENPFQRSASPKARATKTSTPKSFNSSNSGGNYSKSGNAISSDCNSSSSVYSNGSKQEPLSYSGSQLNKSSANNLSDYFDDAFPSQHYTQASSSALSAPIQYRPPEETSTYAYSQPSTYQVFRAQGPSITVTPKSEPFTSSSSSNRPQEQASSSLPYEPSSFPISSSFSPFNNTPSYQARAFPTPESSYINGSLSNDYSDEDEPVSAPDDEFRYDAKQTAHSPDDLFNPHKLHRAFEGESYRGSPPNSAKASTSKHGSSFSGQHPHSASQPPEPSSPASDSDDWQSSSPERPRRNFSTPFFSSLEKPVRSPSSKMSLSSWLPPPWFIISAMFVLVGIVMLSLAPHTFPHAEDIEGMQNEHFLLEPPLTPVVHQLPLYNRFLANAQGSFASLASSIGLTVRNSVFEPVRVFLWSQVPNVVLLLCCVLFFLFCRWRWTRWRQAKYQAQYVADQIFTILSAQRNHIAIQHLQTKYAKEGVSKSVWAAVAYIIESDSRVKRMQKRKGDMPIPRVCWIWESDLDYVPRFAHPQSGIGMTQAPG